MSIQEIEVTLEDLQSIDQDQVVSSCKKVIYYELETAFGNIKDSSAAKLLSASCSMHLKPENTKAPFSPKFIMQDRRGLIASDFPKVSLIALSDFCPFVKIPELKARIADISWVMKVGSIGHAYMAIEAYLESAKNLLDDGVSWIYPAERIERALRLSCMFRRDNQRPDLFENLSSFITSEVNTKKLDDSPFYALRLLSLSHECGVGGNDWILNVAEEIAQARFELGDTRTATNAWECALNSANSDRNKSKQQKIWREIANCHIKDAEIHGGGLIAAGCILKAIDALSKIPNTRQERLELYETMRDHQIESLHQLHEFSSPPQDISEIVHQAKTTVQGKDFFDMLFRLGVLVSRPTDINKLKDQAIDQMKNSFAWMFGGTHIDHEGITVATVPSGMGLSDNPDASAIWATMMKNIGIDHQLAVQGQIRPALDELMIQHHVSEYALESILKNNPFIPYGHECFFVKGIAFGLEGDFLSACHILIPQVENSLRYVARSQGEEPTTLHGDGTQERSGLKFLLDHPVIIEVLGQDIVGNIQAILIDKIYGDLRNQMSHGYMPAGHFFGVAPVFLWWLVLHIVMLPLGTHWKQNYKPENAANKAIKSDS
ncbi:DUF4209 domain-containing protein [Colwellia sp. 75C3]|uniref:DUF4209 domain-containing protein n=1 Tax=Colwellia sp. 75C3 TaxID=888425 RepID=UPI000C32591D|nr:DUF4209 domain-containing protein [Colwellia sp. 75C3]PKG84377.1 DUF4209 domain-containing protein [Colwellia sp. 75C3]